MDFSWLKGLPEWIKIVALVVATVGLQVLLSRTKSKGRVLFFTWVVYVLTANYWWGVPGLLILFALAGAPVAWEALSRASESEKRRRSRLLRALERYLAAEHLNQYEWWEKLAGNGHESSHEVFLKEKYKVLSEWQLLDRFDDEGYTAEELQAMAERLTAETAAAGEKKSQAVSQAT